MQTIEQKLDTLAEYYSQKDALELQKRELLNEIQVPAEIEQIVADGMKQIAEAEDNARVIKKSSDAVFEAQIADIVIPQEYKDALAELDRQRVQIMSKMGEFASQKREIQFKQEEYHRFLDGEIDKTKKEIQAEIQMKTAMVYTDIAQRKSEIEIEFSGKANDADENIKKLEAEIKADMKRRAAEKLEADPKCKDLGVKGKYFHAVYVRGRVTWNTDKMDAWVIDHPFLKEARKEGEPSITLRRI